jgi:hypothetical protein
MELEHSLENLHKYMLKNNVIQEYTEKYSQIITHNQKMEEIETEPVPVKVIQKQPIPKPQQPLSQPQIQIPKIQQIKHQSLKATHKQPHQKKQITYIPKNDSLFWCMYIILNGYEKYAMLGNNINIVIEKNEKINYVQNLRDNKTQLKKQLKISLNDVENKLVNESTIDLKTVFALAVANNIHLMVVFVSKNVFFEFKPETIGCSDDSKIQIITSKPKSGEKHTEFILEEEEVEAQSDFYRTEFYQMENLELRLKGIASYKSGELLEMMQKLKMVGDSSDNGLKDTDKKKKKNKKEMYEDIELFLRV